MVSLVDVAYDFTKFIGKQVATKVLELATEKIPECHLETMKLKESLADDFKKIGSQIESQSNAKLLSATSYLKESLLHLEMMVLTQSGSNFFVKPELEKALYWLREAKKGATESFMDKKNIKPAQRILALEILLFTSIIENWSDLFRQEASIRIAMQALASDQDLMMILKSRGRRFLSSKKEELFEKIRQIIVSVFSYVSHTQKVPRKMLDVWGIPEDYSEMIFDNVFLDEDVAVKVFPDVQVLCPLEKGTVLARDSEEICIRHYAHNNKTPVTKTDKKNSYFLQTNDSVCFQLEMDKQMVHRIDGRPEPDKQKAVLAKFFEEMNLFHGVAAGDNFLVLKENGVGAVRVLNFSTEIVRSYRVASEVRSDVIVCARQVDENHIEVVFKRKHHGYNLLRMTLDMFTGEWSDRVFKNVTGKILSGAFSQTDELFLVSRNGAHLHILRDSKGSQGREIELGRKVVDFENYGKVMASVCVCNVSNIVFIGYERV